MSTYLERLGNFRNKTVLVTGAAGQLGTQLCQAFIDLGAEVIGIDCNLNENKKIDSEKIEYRVADISAKDDLEKIFADIYDYRKSIDILINNAGVSVFETFEERPEESFDFVMDVNLKGTFFCIQNFVKFARQHHHSGCITNVGSVYGVISPDPRIYTDCPRRNSEVYGAVKAGIIQMTRYFAVHLADSDIRVNCVSPGGIYNDENPQGEDFIKNYSTRCPMGRMARADEIVGGIIYLSSAAASYTNGHNLIIDGGMNCW